MHRVNNNERIPRRVAAIAAAATVAMVAAIAGTGSCLPETETFVCDSGRRCPTGQVCALRQDVCIDIGGCGNGHLDPGEICDDGNTLDRDGCRHDCKSTEICGNGQIDEAEGETCDDGNKIDGDGCSSKCTEEVCGNGRLDPGEVCDDGNTVSDDGCSADCSSTEVCGNGKVDNDRILHEDCDSQHTFPLPPPDTAACDSDCTLPECGDGHLNRMNFVKSTRAGQPDHFEQCDDGGDSSGCNKDCTPARCGDGYTNIAAGEDCDPGTARDTATCDGDCTFPRCGDGHTNPEFIVPDPTGGHKEECDSGSDTSNCNGNGNGNSNGIGNCKLSNCNDGYLNRAAGEMCEKDSAGNSIGCGSGTRCDTSGSNGCQTCI